MALVFIGRITYVNYDGDLVEQLDYFDDAAGMPHTVTNVLEYGHRKVVPEVDLGYTDSIDGMTGATIRVHRRRDRFGDIQERHEVVSLNNGDDEEYGETRWGRGDGEW